MRKVPAAVGSSRRSHHGEGHNLTEKVYMTHAASTSSYMTHFEATDYITALAMH
jgi:hypothetical protein